MSDRTWTWHGLPETERMGPSRKTRSGNNSKGNTPSRQTTLPQSENSQLAELMRQFAAQQKEMQGLRQQLAAGLVGAAVAPPLHPVKAGSDCERQHSWRSGCALPLHQGYPAALGEIPAAVHQLGVQEQPQNWCVKLKAISKAEHGKLCEAH
ncbi:hypothetical protein CYMTET_51205 [Cymbomonas tetramitiformis]|uniref:Uncharacterized protein n=1 Tax=Cymbomonas tetramitiformis TaxID=36881 RepID=A0AAE0BMT2_9CHLO|nr:hypothetical protein CYMTET_51205 [Cymbomonas tetramitiformis]